MNKTRQNRWMGLAIPAALGAGTVSMAGGVDIDDQARFAELERQVAQLQAELNGDWLSEQRTEEIRSLVQDVLADADTRSSLLQNGTSGGYDDGFTIGSADGNFKLKMNALQQVRWVFNNQDEGSGDTSRAGFENSRTRLTFSGNVVDSSWLYTIMGIFGSEGGTFVLEDAWIGHALEGGWVLLAGQVEVPATREEQVDDPNHLLMERSLVDHEFSAGYTQGVALAYLGDQLHATFAYTDGHSATGGYNTSALMRDTEVSLSGRAEYLIDGTWDQFSDMTSPRGSEFGALVGGAAHYQNGEYGTTDGEIEVFQWTVDGGLEWDGASLYGAVIGRHMSNAIERDMFGIVVQGGYYLTDDWELVGRFEWGDDDLAGTEDLMIATIGANYHISGNQIKWSSDVGFAFDEVAATWGTGFLGDGGMPAGWRTDASGQDGQVVIRSQLQMTF